MRKGYVQVYTGNGKGKTTAALGLALRAAGAGLKVFIAQFIKEEQCSEHLMLARLGDMITYRQYGRGLIKEYSCRGGHRRGPRGHAGSQRCGPLRLV